MDVCTVGGSIAASFAGEPGSTIDIDIVAALDADRVPDLVAAPGDECYLDERALERAIRQRSSTNLIHHATRQKVELFVARGTPLDAQQLARRLPVRVGDSVLPIHPPEDILLQQLRWFRAGGEVSERQWRDVLAIVRVHPSSSSPGSASRGLPGPRDPPSFLPLFLPSFFPPFLPM